MKLSDIMSATGLAGYAEVGLVLFLIAFVAVVVQVLRRGRALDELALIPLHSTEPKQDRAEEDSQ